MLHMAGIFAKCLENDIPTFLFQGKKHLFLSAQILDMSFVITCLLT